MITQYALFVSALLLFMAAVFVVSLVKATKYNSSWILLSTALIFMAFRRLIEFILPQMPEVYVERLTTLNTWLGILIALLMVTAVFFVKKVLYHLFALEGIRAAAEKRLLNAVISTEEDQRRRFAKDLHDGLGPILSSVKMSLSALNSQNIAHNNQEILQNTIFLVNESITSLKEISNNLSPHILENFGLVKAINSFVSKIEQTGKIAIIFTSDLVESRFDTNTEVIIYRSVCELVNNTLKHAQASLINIDLYTNQNQLVLVYRDNGVGFDDSLEAGPQHQGMGLHNLKSRIASLNGHFEIKKQHPNGIIAKLTAPMNTI
jgi:signal transduction histidine kinase